jgi:Sulfotransferase family
MTPSTERSTRPPAAAAGTRVPDFFIIGHEKCGTTALYNILRQHPQIFMPDRKEPRFFIPDLQKPVPGVRKRYEVRRRTLEDYLSLFAGAGAEQRAGEASPQYIRSTQAARLIAEVQPAARIIAVLREPASFLQTFHLNCVREEVETERDLRKAIALEEQRRRGKRLPRNSRAPDRLFYCEHVRYVEQLRRFGAVFPAEQILVIIYDDFRRDNDTTVRRILRFLDVDETLELEPVEARRERKAVRLPRLHRFARAVQLARRRPAAAGRVSRTVDRLTPRQLRSNAVEDLLRRMIFSVAPPLDEQLMLELRRRFKPEVVALSDYLGRDLVSEWGYDAVG